jgi:protoheme IX farnesyltransferase
MLIEKKIPQYFKLTKPKVTLLNLLVGVTSFVLAGFPVINYSKLLLFCLIGYLGVGGNGVLNSVYDKDIDKLMARTRDRAIPSGNISSKKGLLFGTIMIGSSCVLSLIFFNVSTALMIALGSASYLIVYTIWLKRLTPWNVVIGGFAGCFAAFAGWSAANGALSWIPFIIAALDFIWTPGHLWGLAIKRVSEYRKAGVPMLPVKVGISKASQIVFWLNMLTVVFSFAFLLTGSVGLVYSLAAIIVGAFLIFQSRELLFSSSQFAGFRAFRASMPYLLCLMFALVFDKFVFVHMVF